MEDKKMTHVKMPKTIWKLGVKAELEMGAIERDNKN